MSNIDVSNSKNVYIDFSRAKNEIRDLEILSCDEVIAKVKDLGLIVDSIEQHWHGSKAELYRKQINDIIDAINQFRKTCLEKNIADINAQIQAYVNNEKRV